MQRPPTPRASRLLVSRRVNRILNVVLVGLLLVMVRAWHLAVVQHDQRVEEARRPQRREVVHSPQRGTICDRFGRPLAINRVQYNACVSYAQIKEVPAVHREGRKRVYPRRRHVEQLAELLAEILGLEARHIEDEIYSYAALFPNVPHAIQEDISEEQYFRLRMLEREWPGLCAERVGRRVYPYGSVASHVVGYVGAISRFEYEQIAGEITSLERYFRARTEGRPASLPARFADQEEAARRLRSLRAHAYSLRDAVGKTGIERQCDEALRGYSGRERYEVDVYGNYTRLLPGSDEPISGQRVGLSLSVELQAFAEQLLMENERLRDGRSLEYDGEARRFVPLKQPWIKGGAIVALDPNTGEVLALAGFPRFNPNDFIEKNAEQIGHWFETENYIGAIWDGKQSLSRETPGGEERVALTWDRYLEFVLPKESSVRRALDEIDTIQKALTCDDPPLEKDVERSLFFDLLNLLIDREEFPAALRSVVGEQSLAQYREANQAALVLGDAVRDLVRDLFHYEAFVPWREEEGKAFLQEKRAQEGKEGRYQRPFLEHFRQEERRQFQQFWEAHGSNLLLSFLHGTSTNLPLLAPYEDCLAIWAEELGRGAHQHLPWYTSYFVLKEALQELCPSDARLYLGSMRAYSDLDGALRGRYRFLRGIPGAQTGKDLAAAFYPRYGFGFARSWAFRQASPQGSVFKIVTAYAALRDRAGAELNPLAIVDDPQKRGSGWIVGFTPHGEPIPERHKGGKLLRTHRRRVGAIDLIGALEVSSNAYFGLLASDHLDSPEKLNDVASDLSYGMRTGLDLPGEYAGTLPSDLGWNRTGLYSYACGQHSMTVTPLQTACMLAAISNGGHVWQPRVVRLVAGEEPIDNPAHLLSQRESPYRESLDRLGIGASLWTRVEEQAAKPSVAVQQPAQVRQVPLSKEARSMLLHGLYNCVTSRRGGARPAIIRSYYEYPYIVQDYRALAGQLIGKTGTAERMEVVDLDPIDGVKKYNHTWFAGVSFTEDQVDPPFFGRPELVVIVHLRYGDYGRECAPLAAQIVKKWREIKAAAKTEGR